MVFVVAFIGELLVLFLLARALTLHLSLLLHRWGLGEKSVMHIVALLFLPGTFIHEISHYLFCVILRVRVYGMSLLPKPMAAGYIKMGSVEHQKCDLVRSLLIGAAPFIIGSLLIYFAVHYSTSHNPAFDNWITWAVGFLVFQVGNSMFSSRADMDGSAKFLIILILIACLAYFFGWRVSWEQLDQSIPGSVVNVIRQANFFLLAPLVLDVIIIGVIKVLSGFR